MSKREEGVSFFIRWVTCSVGLWISVRLFGGENTMLWWQAILTFLLAGLIFSAVNSVIRPLIVILSLPFVLITMGLFMLLINGFMVWLAILISPNIEMNFISAIISSLVLSLINYVVSGFSDFKKEEEAI